MTRRRIVDAFPFNNELDMLECRLVELYDAVDHFILVESEQDHQDHAKPLWYAEHRERFAPWADKIVHVVTGQMPTIADNSDPWAREHAQREWIGAGVDALDLDDNDLVLQSDVDEIPRALHVTNCHPGRNLWAFGMRWYNFAVDWQHPSPWYGTVASTWGNLKRLPEGTRWARMRDVRLTANTPPHLTDAGWHFSWLGGQEAALKKLGSFCHPEIEENTRALLADDIFLIQGWHVDGTKQLPVDVDDEWPRWIVEGNAPAVWYRPR